MSLEDLKKKINKNLKDVHVEKLSESNIASINE
jgi:hypothetical protein